MAPEALACAGAELVALRAASIVALGERLRDAPIKEIVVTDSIPVPPQKQLPNMKILSVAPLLADAIKRIHFNESVSKLFE